MSNNSQLLTFNSQLPKGWEVKKLGEVCGLQNGFAFKSKSYVDSSETLNIRMSNIRPDGSFNPEHNIKYLPNKFAEEYSQFILKEGDLVIAMTDMAGDPKILGLPAMVKNLNGRSFLLNQRVGKLTDFDSNIFIPYLTYYLSSPTIKNYYKTKGAGGLQLNISKKDILTATIPVPPLPEQQRIVEILDKAFFSIENAKLKIENNLKNAKEVFESCLQTTFENGKLKVESGEWEVKKLGDVCKIIGGGTPSKKKDEFYTGDILWATVRDMKVDVIEKTEYKITPEAVKNSSTNIIPKGNVIIATRVGLGKVCLLKNDTAINQDLKGIVPKNTKNLSIDFLYRWFTSISNKIINEGTGATVQGVKLAFINSLQISLPPLKEQKQIVQQLDNLSAETKKLETIYQQKITNLDELKKSILQKAFTGELIP